MTSPVFPPRFSAPVASAAPRKRARAALAAAAFAAWAAPALPALAAPSLLVDLDSGQVLHAEDATRPWFPASTTKIMTAYLALKAVREGRMTLDTPLTASAYAAKQPRSKAFIRAGQTVTLDNALKLLMVKSANDIAVVIAENVGGSVEGFAAMMNAEAARLGMRETHFVNPHGWHDPAHVSSARDLAVLSTTLWREFPAERGYWGIGAIQLGNRIMRNTNGLIGRYAGASGIKTGFVCASGFNVVATAERNGRRLMAVVLGASSGTERTALTAELLSGGGRGPGGTLATLPAVDGEAPNMREEICTRRARAGKPVTGEEEAPAEVVAAPGTSENAALSFLAAPSGGVAAATPSLARLAALGPRETFVPLPVWFGPAPGATAAAVTPRGARAAKTPAKPAAATPAVARPAASPAPTRAAARSPVTNIVDETPDAAAASRPAPRARPGAIGGGLEPTPARPAAAAAIRPKPARATTDANKPAADKPATAVTPTAATRPTAGAPKTAPAKPAAAKPAAAKPAAAKPAAVRAAPAAAPSARAGSAPAS